MTCNYFKVILKQRLGLSVNVKSRNHMPYVLTKYNYDKFGSTKILQLNRMLVNGYNWAMKVSKYAWKAITATVYAHAKDKPIMN